jgi:alpha-glucosidase
LQNWQTTIHHDGSATYVDFDRNKQVATIRLRAATAAPLRHVYLRTCPDGEQALQLLAPINTPDCENANPNIENADNNIDWWQVMVKVTMPLFNYRFLIVTEAGETWWLNAEGWQQFSPLDHTDFKLLTREDWPHWLMGTIFYQIFPDRFADGDPTSNVQTGEYQYEGRPVIARQWGELPRSHRESGGVEFFGGDLDGVRQKLDYLQTLGITAIYLNPIFTAPSNHKYDTANFYEVDPHLGGNAAFVRLREAMDQYQMRLVLDIVLNHCGSENVWFKEAQADPDSPKVDYFTFTKYPQHYISWHGINTLPKFNYRSLRLREAIYHSADSVLCHWLKPPYRIDGWRIDVANMMARQGADQFSHKIKRGVRRAVKAVNPETYLVGEHFHDGTSHLQGDELDGAMNYRGFTFPLLKWLTGFDIDIAWQGFIAGQTEKNQPLALLATADMVAQWQSWLGSIPWQLVQQQLNSISTHDIPRVLSLTQADTTKTCLAATLLLTFPGVPSIYYGDEVGLPGGADPDNRRCMPWNPADWDMIIYDHYRNLINLRRHNPALQWGSMQFLYAASHSVAFLREAINREIDERLIVIAQREAEALPVIDATCAGLPNGTVLEEVFRKARVTVLNGRFLPTGATTGGAQIWRVLK